MEIYETKYYEVHLVPRIAEKVANDTTDKSPFLKVKAELGKSGAFDYGNGTAVGITIENLPDGFENHIVLDTRYYAGIKNDFSGFCKEWIKDYWGENLEHTVESSLPFEEV